MGGSGGSIFSGINPSDLQKKIQSAEMASAEGEFRPQVEELLGKLLSKINERDVDSINDKLDNIKQVLGDELEQSFDLKFGGSVAKHTYVDGLSDVDSLLVMKSDPNHEVAPSEVKERVASLLRDSISDAEITTGAIAVTINYSNGLELQLIPAISHDGKTHVPSWNGERWSKINPAAFTKALTRWNDKCANKLVPTIKLAKAINSTLPKAQQLSGYHIEALAINSFRGYNGEYTNSKMLPHLLNGISKGVLSHVKDKTGQSVHVDGYLGTVKSPERQLISHVYERLAKRMDNATAAQSISQWNSFFNNEF